MKLAEEKPENILNQSCHKVTPEINPHVAKDGVLAAGLDVPARLAFPPFTFTEW